MKRDQNGCDGKGVKQSEMFNYSVYSRLGNNRYCDFRVNNEKDTHNFPECT